MLASRFSSPPKSDFDDFSKIKHRSPELFGFVLSDRLISLKLSLPMSFKDERPPRPVRPSNQSIFV